MKKHSNCKKILLFMLVYLLSIQPLASLANAIPSIGGYKGVNESNKPIEINGKKWIYYTTNHSYDIFRIKSDGKGLIKINDVSKYQTVGNYVYCLNKNDGKLYKMNYDGSSNKSIIGDACTDFYVSSNFVYYINKKDNKLYRTNLEGKSKVTIINSGVKSFKTYSSFILYTDMNWALWRSKIDGSSKLILNKGYVEDYALDGTNVFYSSGSLFKIGLDGKGNKKLSNEEVRKFNVYKNYVYYITYVEGDKKTFNAIKFDGTGKKVLSSTPIYEYEICGDYIYYIDGDNCNLKKMKLDGSLKTLITKEQVSQLKIIGQWIYYTDPNFKLSKIKVDGKSKTIISEEMVCNMSIKDINIIKDYIYFVGENSGVLFRASIDGKSNIKLTGDLLWNPNILGNYMYYMGFSEEEQKIYRCDLNGQNKTTIVKGNVERYEIIDNYIYYNIIGNKTIYRVDLQGNTKTKICDNECINLVNLDIYDGYIYYKKYTEEYGSQFCRVKIGESKQEVIIKEQVEKIIFDKDYIYYTTCAVDERGYSNYSFFRIKLDGKDNKKLTEMNVFDYTLTGDYIVFNASGHLYSMKKDGTETIEYTEPVTCIRDYKVVDNYIYYIDSNGILIKTDIKGDNKEELLKDIKEYSFYNFNIFNKEIYYFDSAVNSIYKLNSQGKLSLIAKNVSRYMVYDDFILYYSNIDKKLYKTNKDGMGNIKLSDENVSEIFNN